jgi:hypothetical protein
MKRYIILRIIITVTDIRFTVTTEYTDEWEFTGDKIVCVLSRSHVTTDGQPASLSWNKAPFWGSRPDFYYCLTVAGFVDLGRPL